LSDRNAHVPASDQHPDADAAARGDAHPDAD
jgi:hypothetical protein